MRVTLILLAVLLTTAQPAPAAADCCEAECCCAEGASRAAAADPVDELATVVFHLPLAFNDGAPVPEAQLEALLADVVELAGGFTYSEATGGWLFEGRLYREPVWVVKVGLEPDAVASFIELIVARLKAEFRQEAVWVEESGRAEIR